MSFFFISVEMLKGWAEITFQISPEKSEPGPGLCHQILYPVTTGHCSEPPVATIQSPH